MLTFPIQISKLWLLFFAVIEPNMACPDSYEQCAEEYQLCRMSKNGMQTQTSVAYGYDNDWCYKDILVMYNYDLYCDDTVMNCDPAPGYNKMCCYKFLSNNPTSPTRFPSQYPSITPSQYPSLLSTNYPTITPTNPRMRTCNKKMTRITMLFTFTLSNIIATNTQIFNSLNRSAVELITNKRNSVTECSILSYFVKIWNIQSQQEKANVNITVCTTCSKSQLALGLDMTLIDTNQINDILTITSVTTLSVDVIKPKDETLIESTLYTKAPVSDQLKDSNTSAFWIISAIVLCIICLCCFILSVLFYRKQKKANEFEMSDMKRNKVDSISMVYTTGIVTNMNMIESVEDNVAHCSETNLQMRDHDLNRLIQNDDVIKADDETPGNNLASDEFVVEDDTQLQIGEKADDLISDGGKHLEGVNTNDNDMVVQDDTKGKFNEFH